MLSFVVTAIFLFSHTPIICFIFDFRILTEIGNVWISAPKRRMDETEGTFHIRIQA